MKLKLLSLVPIMWFMLAGFPPDDMFIYMDGWLSQYSQVPTDATIEYRKSVGQLPNNISMYDGVVATESCDHVGKMALLYVRNKWHTVLVFDCYGGDAPTNWMKERNVIAEMGYYLTESIDAIGEGGVRGKMIIFN